MGLLAREADPPSVDSGGGTYILLRIETGNGFGGPCKQVVGKWISEPNIGWSFNRSLT